MESRIVARSANPDRYSLRPEWYGPDVSFHGSADLETSGQSSVCQERLPSLTSAEGAETMHHMREMIATHPNVQGNTNDALIQCIEECYSCAQSCTSCADACLAEEMVAELRQCMRLNLDCADVCLASGSLATRRTGSNQAGISRPSPPVPPPAAAAARNASVTPASMSIAAYVPKAAAAAPRPATPRSSRSGEWDCGPATAGFQTSV